MKIIFFALLGLSLLLIAPISTSPVFAEKTTSIQKTVDVDKSSLINSISHLDKYSQILPDHIQSSKLIDDDIGNMKIGLDWISIDTDIKFIESHDHVVLEVISGDFQGTVLRITMIEKSLSDNIATDVSADLSLQRSWHMGLLTSFVSDDDIESMLHTSLDELVKYSKNPPSYENIIEEKQQFCIFGLCF
ncbi:MAG: hypothetical protein IS860_08485 [Nitrosopumilus sp.]|nr:hypothetical protein [Nitrosopumilus sp.]